MAGPEFLFAHLADAHVGAWPRDPEVRLALRESVLRALEVVDERGCEFLLVSGDLFHTPVPDPAEAAPIAAAIRRLSEHGRRIYVIYGSHDYVAHRTSWLDVLAESGLFVRAAPDPVHAEGERWTLPYLVDAPTGCRIAGISGRAQGLDRGAFLGVDSEAFRAEPGFKIFQFHAAVREYLPGPLRAHIEGISREELPGGCDYYAGGHIHATYEGSGPGGQGLLVNPGAVFGTSVSDIEAAAAHRTHRGLAIVRVRDGGPKVEFVDTAPRDLRVFDIHLDGASAEAARRAIEAELERRRAPGALLFPRLHGALSEGSVTSLGLARRSGATGADATGGFAVHWDVSDLSPVPAESAGPPTPADELERQVLQKLAAEIPTGIVRTSSPGGLLAELLAELGRPISEGESRADYESIRVDAARKVLRRAAPEG